MFDKKSKSVMDLLFFVIWLVDSLMAGVDQVFAIFIFLVVGTAFKLW